MQADIRNKQKWTLREALDTAIAGGKLSPKQLNNIARNQQARTEFEAATGIKLEGLSNKKAVQAIQEHIDGRSKNATDADIESQMRENIDRRIADSKAKAVAEAKAEAKAKAKAKAAAEVATKSKAQPAAKIEKGDNKTKNNVVKNGDRVKGSVQTVPHADEHTPEQIRVMKEFEQAVDNKLVDFAKENLSVSAEQASRNTYLIKKVTEREVSDIKKAVGVDTNGYVHYIKGNSIVHIDKRHGKSGTQDHSMSDVNDIGRIKYVLENYDNISIVLNKNGKPALSREFKNADGTPANIIKYEKRIDGTMYVVEAVPVSKKKGMQVITAYKQKNRSTAGAIRDKNAPQPTSKTVPADTSNQRVTQNPENVNTENNINDKSNKDVAPSKFPQHVQESPDVSQEIKDRVAADEEIQTHEVLHNKDIVAEAKRKVENGEWSSDKFAALDAKQATAEDVAIGLELFSKYQNEGNYDAAYNCVEKLDEIGRRGGQIVQAYTLLRRFTPDGIAYYAQKELNKVYGSMSERMQKKYGEQMKLSEDDINYIKMTMAEALELPNGSREQQVKFGLIQKRITDKIPASKARSLRAFTRINMLANFKTTITRNIGSNAMAAAVNTAITDPVAALADKLVAKKTGVRTTTAGTGGYGKSTVQGIKESVEDYKLGINTRDKDANRYNEDLSDYGKDWFIGQAKSFNETGKFAKVGKALNKVDGLVSFALDAGDRMFYTAEFNKSLQSQMKANNVKEPTADMVETARWVALKRTWQDKNAITRTVNQVVSALNGGKEFGVGSILAPFVKTPVNLAIATIEYSPAGLVKTLAIDARNLQRAIKRGEGVALAQKKFVDGFGKAGAGVMLYIADKKYSRLCF